MDGCTDLEDLVEVVLVMAKGSAENLEAVLDLSQSVLNEGADGCVLLIVVLLLKGWIRSKLKEWRDVLPSHQTMGHIPVPSSCEE